MRNLLRSFHRDKSGNVLLLTGLAFLFLVGIGGAGYDLGKQQLVRQKLQQATDAAALAGSSFVLGSVTDAVRRDVAQTMYELNYPDQYLGVNRPPPNITVSVNDVKVTASTNVTTSFVSNLGVNTIAAAGATTVLIKVNKRDFDLVMVVDESSSNLAGCATCGTAPRMVYTKNSLKSLMDIIFPPGPVNPDVRVGLIGYSGTIVDKWGLTSDKAQALDAVNAVGMVYENYDHYGLDAAFNMITGNTNATISSGRVNDGVGICGPGNAPATLAWADAWFPGSAAHLVANNIQWTLPSCAPTANTQVPPPRTTRSDSAAVSLIKNVVFITDGYIMIEPPGCPGKPCYADFLTACNKLKAAGVTVFTISFVSQAPGDEATLKSCASVDPVTASPRYFFAPDSVALDSALQTIGKFITKVRIVQ